MTGYEITALLLLLLSIWHSNMSKVLTVREQVLVMFRPGLAWKPWLWPGFLWLRLGKIPGQVLGHGLGLFMAWLGLGHSLYYIIFLAMQD
jgi:hypothetical protein